ncbi:MULTISPECIES: DNA primase [Pelosinus]|uniref:DNA primase n=1 Tax=Pelosinus fermentans B4 TaxID=1149862 RepID=I8RDA7_9FIRM|nr:MULTISPECIES: DNA primase [Pelosinus]EIW17228.1 DNA primase [Pelosinus fermentans B4]EIW22973.1 DNA primase [Pelosinus fermentans A11]OAM93986.1 DNA primase [Pelosinus fermentans DSM 17108]SDQ96353.1 DNA primase [Pelosinus fermentans]
MKDGIYDEFIDRLRSESDIVSILSDYVPLKKKGKNYWGCCPFHHENTPSFSVTPDKGFFYCFGCQSGGNVFNFLMKIENISFFDAVKVLAQKMNIPLPEKEKSSRELARERENSKLYRVNEMAREFFYACLTKTVYGKKAREYLNSRGVTDDVIERFKIGFAPPAWDKLVNAFLERGVEQEVLLRAGLIVERNSGDGVYDRFRSRVIFPISDARGRVVGFGGRVIDDSQPKYLNSPETSVFNKRYILFGFDAAQKFIKESGQAIVVEGYMDAITAHAFGIRNVVASLGTAFSPEQAKLLLRNAKDIFFAYDSDAAGQNATVRALSILRNLGANVRVISIPDGKDPDEFIRKHGAEAFQLLIAEAADILEYQIKQAFQSIDYSGLEGKVAVVSKIVPILAEADNAVEVNAYIASISQTLAIDESAIRSEVRKFLFQQQKDKNVNKGKNISNMLVVKQPSVALEQAESHIVRLMCGDSSLIPYIREKLSIEEIQGENRREIINLIFKEYNMGKDITDTAWTMMLSEAANAELSHIMLIDIQYNDTDNIKMVDDCIKNMRLTNLKFLYEQHRLRADELERLGDSGFLQALAESQRINDEINKLRNL